MSDLLEMRHQQQQQDIPVTVNQQFLLNRMRVPPKPNLIDTAELAYNLTFQDWSDIGSTNSSTSSSSSMIVDDTYTNTNTNASTNFDTNTSINNNSDNNSNPGWADPFDLQKINSFTEDILALLLIRILALLQTRSSSPLLPTFRDLSTTTICRTIMADEARRLADETLANEIKPLDWPELVTDEVVAQLRVYVGKVLRMYRSVFYHNCGHACKLQCVCGLFLINMYSSLIAHC